MAKKSVMSVKGRLFLKEGKKATDLNLKKVKKKAK